MTAWRAPHGQIEENRIIRQAGPASEGACVEQRSLATCQVPPSQERGWRSARWPLPEVGAELMNNIIYIIGLVVVVLAILAFLGLR
jgi:hypothetical protein